MVVKIPPTQTKDSVNEGVLLQFSILCCELSVLCLLFYLETVKVSLLHHLEKTEKAITLSRQWDLAVCDSYNSRSSHRTMNGRQSYQREAIQKYNLNAIPILWLVLKVSTVLHPRLSVSIDSFYYTYYNIEELGIWVRFIIKEIISHKM